MRAIYLNEEDELTVSFLEPATQHHEGAFVFSPKNSLAAISLSDAEELFQFLGEYLGKFPECETCGCPQPNTPKYNGVNTLPAPEAPKPNTRAKAIVEGEG